MPTRTFTHDPEYTVGIIFRIRVFTEVEFDCDDLGIVLWEIGGWNQYPVGLTSYYKINVSVETKELVPCEEDADLFKWKFQLRYNIYLVTDLGFWQLDTDIDTDDPWAEYASFETECFRCGEPES